ncbi:LOW QUALITY PROTEIN: hypothetical protein T265_12833 [Opisthorchis viverrini]|uniref:C2H2-type domain-containing protein n=1 Tax=Opisthorchis viverrini TaxID=6198 RepID=A0A075A204_OPIVI|nr:LOW QUALITY PROTEIN: hypothetical protein T265_12833 [Opisthorchis viverrini]KER32272.1 LOW QUALITY PROTEIN: hypothetical protein T265_12833 [Opisthorchis viverrini]
MPWQDLREGARSVESKMLAPDWLVFRPIRARLILVHVVRVVSVRMVVFGVQGTRWLKLLEREFTDRKPHDSSPTSMSRFSLSRLGHPDSSPSIKMAQVSENLLTGRSGGSNPTPATRLPLSKLGQPGSIPALVLPSGGMAAKHRKGVFFPLYDFHHVPVPNECPWNPHLDLYNLQELMKTQNSARDWQCNQCWKRFYSEHALDLHMDNRHRSTVYTGPNATCLALFCPLLRCDVLHPDLAFGDQVFWDEALCTESRFEGLRVQCETAICDHLNCSKYWEIPDHRSSTPTESHVLLIFLAITGVIIYYVTVLMRISGQPYSIPASSLSSPYYFEALKATMQSRERSTHTQRHSASRFRRR